MSGDETSPTGYPEGMPADVRYVAISTDPGDRQIYGGPATPTLPEPPEDRQWIEEYRAMSAGYFFGATEEWASGAGTPVDEMNAAKVIQTALRRHLSRSTAVLAALPDTVPPVPATLLRHERALNLVLRAMLEVFGNEPPASVMEGSGENDSANASDGDPRQ